MIIIKKEVQNGKKILNKSGNSLKKKNVKADGLKSLKMILGG